MITKLDMHLHTKGSDGTGRPEDFVRGIQKAGLDGIVLSDHHRTLTPEGLEVVRAVRAAGLVALVGCEYSTKDGHCLIFGVDQARLKFGMYPTMQSVIDRVTAIGGIAFPSHPFRGVKETLGSKIYQLKNLTHVEAYNGQNEAGNGFASTARPEANKEAVWAAEKMGLGQTGGSDAHVPERIGTCYTEFGSSIRTTKDLVQALKAKDHVPRVNQEMVDDQRRNVRQYSSPKFPTATIPWYHDEEDRHLSRLDRISAEADAGSGETYASALGLDEARSSFQEEEFEEVQRHLAREVHRNYRDPGSSLLSPGRPSHGKRGRKRR